MSTVIDNYLKIIDKGKEKDLFNFLKTLTPADKKELLPVLKKLNSDYSKIGSLGGNRFGQIIGTATQAEYNQYACFVCMNMSEFEKTRSPIWMMREETLARFIDWYAPTWLGDYVNKLASVDSIYNVISYSWILKLQDKKIIDPSPELIASVLPDFIFPRDNRYSVYQPEKLLEHPITLKEHFWFLFEVESNLHYSDRFVYFEPGYNREEKGWMQAIVQLANTGKIDRKRLLKATLSATHKNFNKVLSGWFAQLFADLKPGNEELIGLQKELISVLNAPHSKPVNTALESLTKISSEETFDVSGFLDAAPILIASETKSIVNSTLDLFAKLAKRPHTMSRVLQLACQAFMHADKAIQVKAAKFILSNYKGYEDILKPELANYSGSILSVTRKMLEPILDAVPENHIPKLESNDQATEDVIDEFIPIKKCESVDDLVFLASQVIDNNQPWHLSTFPAELIAWESRIAPHLSKFAPALQRVLKMISKGMNSNQGYLDHMLAVFFVDVCVHWVRTHPEEAKEINNQFDKFSTKEERWIDIDPAKSYLEDWKTPEQHLLYQAPKELLLAMLSQLRQGTLLAPLSTPTHEPCWIEPVELVKRMISYQEANIIPGSIDLQVALSRCKLDDTNEASQLAAERLDAELKSLMLYFFDAQEAKAPKQFRDAWLTASLAKKNKKPEPALEKLYRQPFEYYMGDHEWISYEDEYETTDWDKDTRKQVTVLRKRKMMTVKKEYPNNKLDDGSLAMQLSFQKQFLSIEQNDIFRLLSLSANNIGPLLADITNTSLSHPTIWMEPDRRCLVATLQFLLQAWHNPGNIAHVFLVTCMLSSDKTVINLAGEIWLKAISKNEIDSKKIGEVIGRHESIEFAPLKRFIDLAQARLFGVSGKHNQAFQILIEQLLIQLPAKPITNLQKLLDLYQELRDINRTEVHPELKALLDGWQGSGKSKKPAKKQG